MVNAAKLRSTTDRDAWMGCGREHEDLFLGVVANRSSTDQRSEIVYSGVDAGSATGEEGDSHDWSE